MWEEIHGFLSLEEFEQFVRYLEHETACGRALEVDADPTYGKGELYGGRWFQQVGSRVKWRLISPDAPFRGTWERIED